MMYRVLSKADTRRIAFSTMTSYLQDGKIKEINITGTKITGKLSKNEYVYTYASNSVDIQYLNDNYVYKQMKKGTLKYETDPPKSYSALLSLLPTLRNIRHALNKATPGIPVWQVNIREIPPYLGCADVLGGDHYLIGRSQGVLKVVRSGNQHLAGGADPFLVAVQSHSLDAGSGLLHLGDLFHAESDEVTV